MNPRQKVIFTQLQIASVGVLLLVFGLMWSEVWLIVFGIVVIVYGSIRAWLFARIVSKEDENEEPMDLSLDWDQEKEEADEYAMDEWEEFFTRFGSRSLKSSRFLEDELAKMEPKTSNGSASKKAVQPGKTKNESPDPGHKNGEGQISPSPDPDSISISSPTNSDLKKTGLDARKASLSKDPNKQN